MKKLLKASISVILILTIVFSFSGCGSTKMTEENVTNTVVKAEELLKEFDTKNLLKYIDSSTLSTIITFANKHDQFAELGRAIFKNLSIEINEIDLENSTVTVTVLNVDLSVVAAVFANDLKSNYSTFQLLAKLDDDYFLNTSLKELTDEIAQCEMTVEKTVKLNISKGKKNLVLSFNDEAEDAVSGGALTAIKNIY